MLQVGSAASSGGQGKVNVFHVPSLASAWGRIVNLHNWDLNHSLTESFGYLFTHSLRFTDLRKKLPGIIR